MDLYEVFPQFARARVPAVQGRDLRLIALSAIVYDAQGFYFELGERSFWGTNDAGAALIGVGAPRVTPDGSTPPHQALIRYVRRAWACEVDLLPMGHVHVLDEARSVSVIADGDAGSPYVLILTRPRLGGSRMPDALVQAVYLTPVRRWHRSPALSGLLRIQREALIDFLGPEEWELNALLDESWAEFRLPSDLPDLVRLRPVLALRGLQHMLQGDALPLLGPEAPPIGGNDRDS